MSDPRPTGTPSLSLNTTDCGGRVTLTAVHFFERKSCQPVRVSVGLRTDGRASMVPICHLRNGRKPSFPRKLLGFLRGACGPGAVLTTLLILPEMFPSHLQTLLPTLHSSLKLGPVTVATGTGCLPRISVWNHVLAHQEHASALVPVSWTTCGKIA